LQLIEHKFEAGNGVDINYTAFAQVVDEQYTGQAKEMPKPALRYLKLGGIGGGETNVHGARLDQREQSSMWHHVPAQPQADILVPSASEIQPHPHQHSMPVTKVSALMQ